MQLGQGQCQLRKDVLSNSVIDTVIVPNQKFLFTQFRILLTILICNENFNTQLNEKCAYATYWVKKITRVLLMAALSELIVSKMCSSFFPPLMTT